jgi:hypothetical protein
MTEINTSIQFKYYHNGNYKIKMINRTLRIFNYRIFLTITRT